MLYLSDQPETPITDIQRPLGAADGYLFLGMPLEAAEELDTIPSAHQHDSAVLRARIRVLLHMKNWADGHALSEFGTELYPEENEFTVQCAFALHQMNKGGEAVRVLLNAPEWIRRTGILHYNLACYEAQLGDLRTARQCIRAAIEINASFKKNARQDPDLQRLYN